MNSDISENYQEEIGHIFLGLYSCLTLVKNMYVSKAYKDFKKVAETMVPLITSTSQIQEKLKALNPPSDKTSFHNQCEILVENTLKGLTFILAGYEEDYRNSKGALFGGAFQRKSPKVADGFNLLIKSQEMFANLGGINIMSSYVDKIKN